MIVQSLERWCVALQAYAIAKVLSEKEASKLAEENGISLAAVCPVATVGASPAPVANESLANVLSLLSGESYVPAVLLPGHG